MGIFDKFFGPPDKDKFAKLVMQRLTRVGVVGPLHYDREGFLIKSGEGSILNLHNAYAEYCRAEKRDRETVMQTFVRSWASNVPIPEEFEDVKPDLMPVLRARSYYEVDFKRMAPDADLENYPYQIIAEQLCLSLAYDLPTSMMTVTQEDLNKWGVTLYEALEVAKENLRERTNNYAQFGALYTMIHGDSYDATRLILTDSIAKMEIEGEVIAMVPNRDSLLLASAGDREALGSMLKLAEEGLSHERYISGLAMRLCEGEWEPWLPTTDHPLYAQFWRLRLQTVGRDYESQKELLEAKLQQEARDLYVASFSAVQNDKTSELTSYSVWTDGVPTLLPRTDIVVMAGPNEQGDVVRLASGRWDIVKRVAGHLMASQENYPERFLVESFPSEDELREIGTVEPFDA